MRPMEQLSVVFNLLPPPHPDLVESMDMTALCSHQVCKQIIQTYISLVHNKISEKKYQILSLSCDRSERHLVEGSD